jgi:DNA polymerase III alpha subunit
LEIRLRQKDKQPWAQMTLEDQTGSCQVNVYNEVYVALARPLSVGDIVVVCGQMDPREEQPKLNVTQVLSIPEAREQLLRELILHLPLGEWSDPARWSQLRELVMDAPGPIKLRIICSTGEGGRFEMTPADNYGVVWTPEFKSKLEAFLGEGRYELFASTQLVRPKRKAWQQRN